MAPVAVLTIRTGASEKTARPGFGCPENHLGKEISEKGGTTDTIGQTPTAEPDDTSTATAIFASIDSVNGVSR